MAAPTLISYTETAWNATGTSKSSASISWQTGDVICVIAGSEANDNLSVPTATGLTFASQKNNVAASTCGTRVSAVVAGSNGSDAVTVTNPSSVSDWGFGVWVWRGSGGIGNSSEQHTATLTVSLTPTAADSAIVWGAFDFAAAALQTITPTPSNTRQRVVDSGSYTLYVADLLDQVSGGAVSYGISGAGSGPFSIVVLEIKTGAGGAAFEDDTFKQFQPAQAEPTVSVW
jgi:hypothetical protein